MFFYCYLFSFRWKSNSRTSPWKRSRRRWQRRVSRVKLIDLSEPRCQNTCSPASVALERPTGDNLCSFVKFVVCTKYKIAYVAQFSCNKQFHLKKRLIMVEQTFTWIFALNKISNTRTSHTYVTRLTNYKLWIKFLFLATRNVVCRWKKNKFSDNFSFYNWCVRGKCIFSSAITFIAILCSDWNWNFFSSRFFCDRRVLFCHSFAQTKFIRMNRLR